MHAALDPEGSTGNVQAHVDLVPAARIRGDDRYPCDPELLGDGAGQGVTGIVGLLRRLDALDRRLGL